MLLTFSHRLALPKFHAAGRHGGVRLPGDATSTLNTAHQGQLARERRAGNVRMPVYGCAVWIVLPRPRVQRVESWKSKAVRACEIIMKELAHELRVLLGRDEPCPRSRP